MVANNKKWTYETIKQMVEEQGYSLIEFFEPCKENSHKPKILISNGYEEKLMYFDNFKRGKFSFKRNTLDIVKNKIENHYNLKLDYIKRVKEDNKQSYKDTYILRYDGVEIERSIDSLYHSIHSGNNIFTKRRLKKWDTDEIMEFLTKKNLICQM